MKLLFLHGWQSTPGGLKPTCLKNHGHVVLNPALPDDDFAAAVRIAQAEYDQGHPDVVVGSSRGGAVAMNISSGTTPLVLLCPAWKTWGTATTVKPNTIILHSESDDTVPIADSRELLKNSGLPESALIVVGTEHRLADDESLESMVRAVESLGIAVTGIDPAPSKGLTIWSGVASGPQHIPSSAAADWISKEIRQRKNWLICWDSPLSFDSSISFSDRPVDKVVRAAVMKWVQEGIIGPKEP